MICIFHEMKDCCMKLNFMCKDMNCKCIWCVKKKIAVLSITWLLKHVHLHFYHACVISSCTWFQMEAVTLLIKICLNWPCCLLQTCCLGHTTIQNAVVVICQTNEHTNCQRTVMAVQTAVGNISQIMRWVCSLHLLVVLVVTCIWKNDYITSGTVNDWCRYSSVEYTKRNVDASLFCLVPMTYFHLICYLYIILKQ